MPQDASFFNLEVKSGNYTSSKNIFFNKKQNSIFLQTNKAIFAPGDLLQYRIFSIDSESNALNPVGFTSVTLTDGRNNEIYKVENFTFTNGKYEGQFKLSSSPILGNWNFVVRCNQEVR